MFPGKKFRLGEQEYVVPALTIGQLRNGALEKLREHDELVAAGKAFEAMYLRAELILAALRRNYPSATEDLVLDTLDLHNIGPIWLYVLGVSGFTPGEDQAATQAESGT